MNVIYFYLFVFLLITSLFYLFHHCAFNLLSFNLILDAQLRIADISADSGIFVLLLLCFCLENFFLIEIFTTF